MKGDLDIFAVCAGVEGGSRDFIITDSLHNFSALPTESHRNRENFTVISKYVHIHIPTDNYEAFASNQRVISCQVGNETCDLHFEVDFMPFVDQNVSKVQTGGVVECPIRAPGHMFNMMWTGDGRHVCGNYTKASHFHSCGDSSGVFTCSLVKLSKVLLSANISHDESEFEIDITSLCMGCACTITLTLSLQAIGYYLGSIIKRRLDKKIESAE